MQSQYPEFDFQILLDSTPDLHVLRNIFGLGYSRAANWSPYVIFWYAKQYLEGRDLENPDGDPNQLGGDFTFDQDGNCLLEYRSQGPLDRVSIDDVLRILSNNQSQQDQENPTSQTPSTQNEEEECTA